ncbi:MAG: CoA transferase, partial [Syntrophomonadaceae bacterium]|nr:CoA transferase [Syntrophomonadaceae bacterium]
PVRDIPEVMADNNLLESGAIAPVEHPGCGEIPSIKAAGLPIHYGLTEAGFDRPAPFLGQHNNEIYGQLLNMSTQELEELKKNKII